MKNKKLTSAVHRFLDVEAGEMPSYLVDKLRIHELYTYYDMFDNLREHLYNIETLLDKMKDEPKFFNLNQKVMINRIARLLNKNAAGYFRFVSN